MCINHLIQYKEKHIHILDELLETINGKHPKSKDLKETKQPPKETIQHTKG